jgi:hypothetical protein
MPAVHVVTSTPAGAHTAHSLSHADGGFISAVHHTDAHSQLSHG